MNSHAGKYIVLEGPEGVGKTTQVNELARRLQTAGLPVRVLREPDSQSDLTARAIRQLTQDPRYPMNTRTEVLLYNAARAQSLQVIKNSVEQGVICIVDRNYLTTLAIQYYGRGDVPDYGVINNIISFAVGGIEPDLCIIMDAPVESLAARAKDRDSGERFDNLDISFLERVRTGYLWEAKQRNLPVVDASGPAEQISDTIWRLASNILATRRPSSALTPVLPVKVATQPVASLPGSSTTDSPVAAAATADDSEKLVTKTKDGSFKITSAGRKYLDTAVTNSESNVYAFTDKLSPVTIAAAMARLSRRGDDMRITILDEFANQLGKDERLLQRVITAYGDDSVQQLAGMHLVVEHTSKLMTKILERGRLASYLEQSTRYIYYDQKNKEGQYRYHIPKDLKPNIKQEYRLHMDRIFDLYSSMVHKLTDYVAQNSDVPLAERDGAWKGAIRAQACDAVRAVLPLAVTSTVGIYASGQALENMIMYLLSHPLPEAQSTGQKILKEVRKVTPILFERADKPSRGGATTAYRATTTSQVSRLANDMLPEIYSDGQTTPVTLTDVWPRNELDIVADMLYEHSHLPLEDIKKTVAGWPYQQKTQVMQTYFGERLNRRHKPGRALEKIHYSWDIVCSYGAFCDLQRHRLVDDMEWQEITPRYGFDTPELIDQADLTDDYEECFAISLKLHSILQQAGYREEAQYATLLGHKMRWKVTYNAREAFHLHELRTSPQGHPEYRKLVIQMHEKLGQVHPMIAGAMKFVNTGEDDALTRLAAERYTQFKLDQLDKGKKQE